MSAEATKPFSANALELLRAGPFRRYIIGSLVSDTGTWMQVMAQAWVMSTLTNIITTKRAITITIIITVTITAWPKAGLHALGDDIGGTINYSGIARFVRDVVDERRDKLIETLAEKIAERLLRDLPIRRLRIELRKFVVPDAAYVAVIIMRDGLAH